MYPPAVDCFGNLDGPQWVDSAVERPLSELLQINDQRYRPPRAPRNTMRKVLQVPPPPIEAIVGLARLGRSAPSRPGSHPFFHHR
jgi:hypothetical protein